MGRVKDEVELWGDFKRDKKEFFFVKQKAEINREPRGRLELIRRENFTLSLAILTTDIVFKVQKAQKEFPRWDECPASPAERGGRMKATETALSAWFLTLAFRLFSMHTFKM